MKLLFLGDSFTWGGNIDLEYGLQHGLVPSGTSYTDHNKSIYKLYNDKELLSRLSYEREKLIWPTLLSNELKYDFKNYSTPAASLQYLHYQFMQAEYENQKIERAYVICLPITSAGRMVISSESAIIKNSIYETFSNYCFSSNAKDIDFFKKYFNEDYFTFTYIQSLSSIIMYLKNKNIKFTILPTWQRTIEIQLKTLDNKINHFIDYFILNELSLKELQYSFDISKVSKLPCMHPSIEAQKQIVEQYLKHPFFIKILKFYI